MKTTTGEISPSAFETRSLDADPARRADRRRAFADDILAARERLRGVILETPCVASTELGAEAGVRLFLKRDHLQVTGSFKERGAAHALLSMSAAERSRGVVAASAGNHALGLARHGRRMGVNVTLVMPLRAARAKVDRCRALGAEVRLVGSTFDEAGACARELAGARGCRLVHPFDDDAVIAGQGTMALEMLEQVPDLDAVVLPVGGGGLLAGAALALKVRRPDVSIVAVEPAAAPSFQAAWKSARPVTVEVAPTLADGLAVARVGNRAVDLTRGLVDSVVTVTEAEIAWAMLRLFEVERAPVEGAGATALAALLAGKCPSLAGRTVVVPVCGSNVDAGTFAQALHLGLESRHTGSGGALAG